MTRLCPRDYHRSFARTFVVFWIVSGSKSAFAFATRDTPWRVTTSIVMVKMEVEVKVEVEVEAEVEWFETCFCAMGLYWGVLVR